MSLKDFLIKSLQVHKCEADFEVLSDYIVALIDNGTKIEELSVQLNDFLHEETEEFISELNEYLKEREPAITMRDDEPLSADKKSKSESDNGTGTDDPVVDYEDEDDGNLVIPLLRPPQRALREYSPERRDHPPPAPAPAKPRPACTNYLKRGTCRYGDNCRYAHIQRVNPSVSTPSRVKLSNLPLVMLNPAEITEVMSKYGHVTGATVYPERAEAKVQFARGEEALKAFNEFVYDGEEGIIIEIESNKTDSSRNEFNRENFRNNKAYSHNQYGSSAQDVKLQALLSLQQRQQSILETNLSVQQSLLATLQNPVVSEAERIESLATLKSIQDGVVIGQEMLRRTTELVVAAAKERERPNDRFNNVRHGFNNVNQKPQRHTAYPSHKYNAPPTYSLDLRPTTLKLTPLPNLTDIHALKRHFSPYGPLQSLIITEQGQSALIKYQRHDDAVKALKDAGKSFEGDGSIELSFIK